jgi:hypothetical protein
MLYVLSLAAVVGLIAGQVDLASGRGGNLLLGGIILGVYCGWRWSRVMTAGRRTG